MIGKGARQIGRRLMKYRKDEGRLEVHKMRAG
jgi:hypothetical protein